MGRIRLLSDALASQVAAGEVVERPASVVKELVENSIDAGAKNVEIRVQRGGIALIRVMDDGCGMSRDDALMCIERHATSKIRTKEDLAAIGTLGFRGEALPSIASVSKFRLATREQGALSGTEILINGGRIVSVKESGEPAGTQVEVRSLFYNIPARRKFLRTENTEFSHLEQVVRTQAIAHPELRFALVHGDRLLFQLPATGDPLERIRGLAGGDLAGRLLRVPDVEIEGVAVGGFIGPPGMGRSDRRQQLVFLNGRPVESPLFGYALREGYHTALMKGQYPVTFLFLKIDPGAVDVNVHPAKREVRFHNGNAVRDAIIRAVQDTLTGGMRRPVSGVGMTGTSSPSPPGSPVPPPEKQEQDELIPMAEQRSLRRDWAGPPGPPFSGERGGLDRVESGTGQGSVGPPPSPRGEAPEDIRDETETPRPEDFRLLGVLARLYVLMEGKEGLVLMDQHAAHERVLFEEMRRRMEAEGVPAQALLAPLMVELPPRDFDLISQNLEVLAKLGIGAEPFGGNTLKIDALPTFLKSDDPERFLQEVIEELRGASDRMSKMRLGEDMVATTVCRHAVKANDPLHPRELEKLLVDLLACEMPYCCPHGRPTLIQISFDELEKKFGRKV